MLSFPFRVARALPSRRRFGRSIPVLLACAGLGAATESRAVPDEVAGLVLPLTKEEFNVRTAAGDVRVRWTDETRVGHRVRDWGYVRIRPPGLTVSDLSTPDREDRRLVEADGVIYMVHSFEGDDWAKTMSSKVLRADKGRFYLTTQRQRALLPTRDDPRMIGELRISTEDSRFLDVVVEARRYRVNIGANRRLDGRAIGFEGIGGRKDIRPFVTEVVVRGQPSKDEGGEFLIAAEIVYETLPDSTNFEDPKLPRLLVIGDSISDNYDSALGRTLYNRVNVFNPPENAGSTGHGQERIRSWLGAFDEPGRGWDFISFNFGHWNSTGREGFLRVRAKKQYQDGLEKMIGEMQKTGAQLIFATTTPIPRGKGTGDTDNKSGKSVLINEWAAEVMARHPEIEVVDLYAVVEKDSLYSAWWELEDVHFTPTLAVPLGQAVAARVMELLEARDGYAGKRGLIPPKPPSVAEVENQKCCLPPDLFEKLLGEARSQAPR